MLVILWLGAVAELIYFPALLAGPLGLVFKPRKKGVPHRTVHDAHVIHEEPRQPQLQIVRHDEAASDAELEELAVVAGADGNGHAVAAPHRAKTAPQLHLRQDTPHGRE